MGKEEGLVGPKGFSRVVGQGRRVLMSSCMKGETRPVQMRLGLFILKNRNRGTTEDSKIISVSNSIQSSTTMAHCLTINNVRFLSMPLSLYSFI